MTDAYHHKGYFMNGYTIPEVPLINIRLHRLFQHNRPLELSPRPQQPAAAVVSVRRVTEDQLSRPRRRNRWRRLRAGRSSEDKAVLYGRQRAPSSGRGV